MNRKALSLLIVVVMLLSAIPAALSVPAVAATPVQQGESPQQVTAEAPSNFIPGEVLQKEIQKVLEGSGKTVRLIVAPDRDHEIEVYNTLKKLGRIDPISKPEFQFIVVEMPASNVEKLAEIPGILHVWKDEMVKLQEPVAPEVGMGDVRPTIQDPKLPDMFMSVFKIHAYDTWINHGVLGDNVTVAVLDTGIDVGHPFLQVTLDGRPKIIDIYDASDEGLVEIYYSTNTTSGGYIAVDKNVTLFWGAYAPYYGHDAYYTNYTMGTYYVGNITGDDYYIGLLPERYFDFNNLSGNAPPDYYGVSPYIFGNLSDVYPVLIVNQSGNFVAYIDFNLDNNFTDDQPMGVFDLTHDYVTVNSTKVNIAFQGFYGDFAYFMWDAHGHGTHVSGTVAGVPLPNDPVFNGTFTGLPAYGVAPNAQLMEVKVLPGEFGFGATSWIISGMIYAASNGADVISMSLGGGGEINDGIESPENFYVNLLTNKYGVTFAIAAGNEGPTTNTVHSPGDSDLAITVGNYVDNERESFWYGVDMGIISGPAMSSSRGPRDDGMLDPDVMAPGTDIFSSLPMWYTALYGNPYRYYGIWSGTSMATPHVSGAVALMVSYAKQHNITYNPIMLKRVLELSAKPVNGTLIDQGFGLIQVDKAIEELENLSQEPTTYIFAGTTYTGFKNPIGVPTIPISLAYVDSNGYFQNVFGFPYLYRGVYIRNEYPGSVPIYFYPMDYVQDYGLNYTASEKVYKISTNVDWIIPNTTEVVAGNVTFGRFSINIDYSKLQKSGTYVGLVYIDDPDTSYIDGYVAVTVDIPVNPNGESHAKLSDTEKPGEAKHYFVKIPRGTRELRVTLRVPADANGTPMGRTTLLIARPLGEVVASYVPGYYYVGANPAGNVYEYTWVVPDPVEGTWEITAYSSIFAKYWSGYDTSQYEIEVSLSSVSVTPEIVYRDVKGPINTTVQATFTNGYTTFNASVTGYGMGRLDLAPGQIRNVSQDEWDLVGALYVDPTTYFIRFGITQPEDPTADLDLYVYYFPTLEDLINFTNYVEYTDQIGPTSDEVFEQFMPEPGYYLVKVYGWDTAGYDPIHYTFYYQMLNDTGDVSVDSTPFEFAQGASMNVNAEVSLHDNGTYLGVIGLTNIETNNVLTYVPLVMQVGQPSMTMIVSDNATLGKMSVLQIKLIDPVTGKAIHSPTKVVINGRPYYTDNGYVVMYFVPTSTEETFDVQAINEMYMDIVTTIKVKAAEPFTETVKSTKDISSSIVEGNATIIKEPEVKGTTVTLTVNGTTNTTSTVMVVLPKGAEVTQINVEPEGHLVDWWTEDGEKATYLFVKVRFASPVTVSVKYSMPPKISIPTLNFLGYRYYHMYLQQFNELYQKALELGVDNETLQEALSYNETAAEYYKTAEEIAGGNLLINLGDIKLLLPLRQAYLHEMKAVKILQKAVEEIENSEG
ncbi:S8 family serine peptidase [Thermococcus sp. JdF3]|uniref:S8 family peptidase n=1 Tax=Thermococcus sp. JdF3 TaxID=1638258 RepID=UPI00143B7717|nr:S8 family serine peptidase [Thermococcus sp. JdF3]NJE01651.1 pyrolysin (pls) [Thermococcus sp. JdF3]